MTQNTPSHDTLTLTLPCDLVTTLEALAQERGESLDHLARRMLDREVMRMRSARASSEARKVRLARLRNLLAPDMERATGWNDLQSRLALYGVELRSTGGGVMLHDLITGEGLCPSAALGFDGRDLARRFGTALPGVAAAA